MNKSNILVKNQKTCRICLSKDLFIFLKIGKTPLADLFVKSPKAKEMKFSLNLAVCKKCFLVQLLNDVDDELLFGNHYAFYTGGSPSSLKYFKEYASDIIKRFPQQAKNLTLEIASNDGTLLKYFQEAGCNILGIDPAKNVVREANNNGIETYDEFFNLRTTKKILKKKGKPSIILANNVIAHVTNPLEFMMGVKEILSNDGIFIFECQYFPYLLFNNQFDNVYHEHRSFFSFTPLVKLLNDVGLKTFDIEEYDTQGGSIRVFTTHTENKVTIQPSVKNKLKMEKDIGLFNLDTYKGFESRINYIKVKLLTTLRDLKAQGMTIAGYGASAKSNTLLNYCGIDTKYLDFILDKTPYKFGLYTPGTHIPVVGETEIVPDYYLLLVWNYASGILSREQKYRDNGGKFIIPIPTPHII